MDDEDIQYNVMMLIYWRHKSDNVTLNTPALCSVGHGVPYSHEVLS